MFQELLNKSSVTENKMTIYRIMAKNAQELSSEDWSVLSGLVTEVAEMDNDNKRFLIEETVMSLYQLLAVGIEAPDMGNYISACAAVTGTVDGRFSEAELTALVDCLETLKTMWENGTPDLQKFYEDFEDKIAQFAAGRYCVGMFRRRLLDIIIQVGNFQKMRKTIQKLSKAILSLDTESFEKSAVLNNEFMQF